MEDPCWALDGSSTQCQCKGWLADKLPGAWSKLLEAGMRWQTLLQATRLQTRGITMDRIFITGGPLFIAADRGPTIRYCPARGVYNKTTAWFLIGFFITHHEQNSTNT